jgi:calcineurin-like phosphoesterase family protein
MDLDALILFESFFNEILEVRDVVFFLTDIVVLNNEEIDLEQISQKCFPQYGSG